MQERIPLFVPGPTSVHDSVLEAQRRAPVYHRDEEYGALLTDTAGMLAEVLGTRQDVYLLSGSGTAALETVALNLCRPGERVVVASNGYFGERLGEMCRRLGLEVSRVRAPWGEPVTPADVAAALPEPATVLVVQHETSTGCVNDVAGIGRVCAEAGSLLVVDAVSGAGAVPVQMDRWGVDVLVATSQKGIGGTPGIGVLAISPRAWDRHQQVGSRTFAGDWSRIRRSYERVPPESLWTPPVSIVAGLHAALVALTRERPLAESLAERARIGSAVRAGLTALGFRLLSSGAPMAPVSVACPPDGVDADALIAAVHALTGVRLAAGQGELQGKVIRVSHLGIALFHVLGLLGALDAVLPGGGDAAAGSPTRAAALAYSDRSGSSGPARAGIGAPG